MRRIAAGAIILIVAVFACVLPAQNPFAPDRKIPPLPIHTKASLEAEPYDAQSRLAPLAEELGREINSAINEGLLAREQADRLIKEVEIVFTVRLARIELMRMARRLDKLQQNSEGVDGSDELQRLRQKLEELKQLPESDRTIGAQKLGGLMLRHFQIFGSKMLSTLMIPGSLNNRRPIYRYPSEPAVPITR